ncbi:dynamin family protein [Geminocystis sp. CENA526]|uniref:dynamin family protein n=1 Tax=Geminocystis sp. CENA526 TaxID=1355871 RepID=UPI003D6E6458
MTKKTYEVFQSVENKANLLAGYWDNFKAEIIQHLPESYHGEIEELSNNLEKSLGLLIDELRHPTLTLATTGTTSSGKSTLVNFLCGADIVPTAVSEMSAGSVTIEYSEEKVLIIEETTQASWECGEWRNISDEGIYQRLEQVMISYIDNKKNQSSLAYPKFLIHYPFRLFKEYERDLPRGVRVKLLDLPGLSYVGDETNMEVIRQCREALCLVTYNSQETDPQKVRSLLLQVVEQVKSLGGSPDRMLFILNKIDVFRNDRDWVESERRFVEKTTQSIKKELTEQLSEYTQEIENLKIIKLSTLPALFALQIRSDNQNDSTLACRDADRKCSQLIDEDILEDLPRKAENWSSQDKIRVAEDLWQKSYAGEFQEYLSLHITQHFPKLVIPQAIERFNVAAGNSIAQWAVQTTTAILNSSKENYQQESERIQYIEHSLNQFLQENNEDLRRPFEKLHQKCQEYLGQPNMEDLVMSLEGAVEELQKTDVYKQIANKLVPLYDWQEALSRGVNQILEAVSESLNNGKITLDSPHFKKADPESIVWLENNLRRLINSGYSYSIAKDGQEIEAKNDDDKKKLKEINDGLNELSSSLNQIVAQVLYKLSTQEINRMYEAVSELFKFHLAYLEKGGNDIAPNIIIRFPTSKLGQITKELNFLKLSFESKFDITPQEYTVQYRSWKYWLGIFRKKETRSSDNAIVPSTKIIVTDWKKQLKKFEPDMLKQVVQWLLSQINDLTTNVEIVNNTILNQYRERLEKAIHEVTFDYQKQQNVWKPMQQKAKKLEQEFSQLGKLQEKEEGVNLSG